jgi:hypothetical protein
MKDINDWPLLEKEKLFDYLRWNSYRSEYYKLFYVATPKVACTSLKWWFADLEGYTHILRDITDSDETDPDLVIHDTFHRVAPDVTGLRPEALSEALTSDSYFRFALVRNPYKRIFSAFQSKLLLKEPLQIGPYLQCHFFNCPIKCADDIAAAFEGFLEHLATNEAPSYLDVHWTPQMTLLRPDLINYSKLIKIENVKELSQTIAERYGGNIPDPFTTRHTNESLIPYHPKLVTDRSSELIRSLYAMDFEAFGYDMQLPRVKKTFSTGHYDLAFKAIALIRGRHKRLGERNLQINNLNQQLTKKEQLTVQNNEELKQKNEEINLKNEEIKHKNEELDQKNETFYQTNEELKQKKEELNQILVSKSWRITKPLRVISDFITKRIGSI